MNMTRLQPAPAGETLPGTHQPAKLVILQLISAYFIIFAVRKSNRPPSGSVDLPAGEYIYMEKTVKRFALVTGASSGMGLEYAKQLAEKGRNVIVVSNRDDDNRKVAAMLTEKYGVEAVPYYADLSKSEASQALYYWTVENGYVVDILISNAGMLVWNKLENTPAFKVDLIVGVHCLATTHLCRLFGSDMKARALALSKERTAAAVAGGAKPGSRRARRAGRLRRGECGRILIMSSLAAYLPYPTISTYAATKAYSKSLGTSLWHELRDYGVSVTTVCPSAVDTPLITLAPNLRRLAHRLGVMIYPQTLVKNALGKMFKGRRIYIPTAIAKLAVVFCGLLPQHCVAWICHIPVLKRIFDAV